MTESLPLPVVDTNAPLGSMIPVAQLRQVAEQEMTVDAVEVPREAEREGALVLRGRLLRSSDVAFPTLRDAYFRLGYTPMLRKAEGSDPSEVTLRIFRGVVTPKRSRLWINVLLFALTILSTLFVGSLYGDNGLAISSAWDLLRPENLIKGWPFAATLLGILTAHEFGHYFVAKYHKVAVTLPYFIPMPISFGTLGAFIQLKEPIPDRRKLFDIGVAGPLAGLVLAVPLLFIGLASSPVLVPPPMPGAMLEGNSILYLSAKWLVFGKVLPNPVTGEDVMMNQVTFAAWIGLLVTALNLLPVGQLDGGHTVFALFGKKARYANLATVAIMALFALASLGPLQQLFPFLENVGFTGWFLWLLLIVFVIGIEHPPALDDVTQLDGRRRWLGYFTILVFLITFVPVPMRVIG